MGFVKVKINSKTQHTHTHAHTQRATLVVIMFLPRPVGVERRGYRSLHRWYSAYLLKRWTTAVRKGASTAPLHIQLTPEKVYVWVYVKMWQRERDYYTMWCILPKKKTLWWTWHKLPIITIKTLNFLTRIMPVHISIVIVGLQITQLQRISTSVTAVLYKRGCFNHQNLSEQQGQNWSSTCWILSLQWQLVSLLILNNLFISAHLCGWAFDLGLTLDCGRV